MSAGFLLRKDDYPAGISTPTDVQRLAALLNPYLNTLNALTAKGVNLSDNLTCEVQVGKFAHGVPSQFSLKRMMGAKGCLVLGCDSAVPVSVIIQPVANPRPNSLPQVSVTVWFANPAAVAKVAILLLPEGQLTTTQPADLVWIAPTLLGTWVNFGGTNQIAGYMKDANGFVHLRGVIKSGTIGSNAFILPVGYRPALHSIFAVDAGAAYGRVRIDATSGGVTPDVGLTTSNSLDGINFDTRS